MSLNYQSKSDIMDIMLLSEKVWISRSVLINRLKVSENTIKSGVRRKLDAWKSVKIHGVSYHLFDNLREDYQKAIFEIYGNPEQYARFNFIRRGMVEKDEDTRLLHEYSLNGKGLTPAQKEDYRKACAFLAWLDYHGTINKKMVKRYHYKSLGDFWKDMVVFVKTEPLKLPHNVRSLERKFKAYQSRGVLAVVKSTNTTAKNAKKLTKLAEDYIVSLMMDDDGRKFSAKVVTQQYNMVAEERGWKQVNLRTIQRIIQKRSQDFEIERHGESWFNNYREMKINQRRVSQPHLQWQLDGTPEHLWYYDEEQKTVGKLYVFKIMDAHSDYIVGYSIGETESTEMVLTAFKMACLKFNVKPHEIRHDRGSSIVSKESKEVYKNLGITSKPSMAKRSRSRRVELWQSIFNEQVLVYFKNKSSGNVTVKTMESRQNIEKFKKHWKEYPSKAELVTRVEFALAFWNNYKAEWDGRTPSERLTDVSPDLRKLQGAEIIESFYVWRMKSKKQYQPYFVDMEGIEFQVKGRKYRYLPTGSAREVAEFINRHIYRTKFFVKYDPSNLSSIALYVLPDGKEEVEKNFAFYKKCVLKGYAAESQIDATEEEKTHYQRGLEIQKQQRTLAKENAKRIKEVVAQNGLEAIRIDKLQKDAYNKAKLDMERNRMMGLSVGDVYDQPTDFPQQKTKDNTDIYDGEYEEEEMKEVKRRQLDIYG